MATEAPDFLKATGDSIAPPSSPSGACRTGAIIPEDMRVTLVRADSANLDTILSVFFSVIFGVFGIFLGALLTATTPATGLEKLAIWGFGVLGVAILGWWIYNKVKQSSGGVTISLHSLSELTATKPKPL